MKKNEFLNLRHLPARLSGAQAAWLLGFEEHDVPKLIANKVLKPLGRPQRNCVKSFWLPDVQDLAADRERLAKASDGVRRRSKQDGEALLPTDKSDMQAVA